MNNVLLNTIKKTPMKTYQVRQKLTDRTLTVELPEEFEGSEVEVEVVILQNGTPDSNEGKNIDKWEALRRAKGIARDSTLEMAEEEVTISKETVPAEMTKEERLAVIRRFAGIVKPPFYEPTEDEWYLQ